MWQALCVGMLLVASLCTAIGDDSLKSAIKALHRKQRDISLYQNPYLIGNGQPEDIGYGFQKSMVPGYDGVAGALGKMGVFDSGPLPQAELGTYDGTDNNALEKLILDYLQDEEEAERYASRFPGGKRSVFRENSNYPVDALQTLWNEQERDEQGSAFRERNPGKWRLRNAHALVRNYGGLNDPDRQAAQEDALNLLNSIWEKYRAEEPDTEDQDVKGLFEYAYPEEDKRKRQYGGGYSNGYDFFNSPFSWSKRDYTKDEDVGNVLLGPSYHLPVRRLEDSAFDDRYRLDKRYPIAKRSTNHQHRRAPVTRTDPKIAQEISNIFSPQKENSTENAATAQTATTTPVVKNQTDAGHKDHGQKELSTGNALDKPVEVKKKSVRWADYFGIDKRRKKSAGYPAASDDWLVDQYMKAAYGNRYSPLYDKPKRLRGDDMDSKLRAMEDLIVDQAIKYTGAHEGATDPREMDEVKDQVMGQLAAAYSLEKMRRALGEFRSSIQQQTLKPPATSHQHIQQPLPSAASESNKVEIKSKAQPTAQAKLEKKKSQVDVWENQINTNNYQDFDKDEDCPVLDEMVERCSVASAAALDKEMAFLPLCVLHQICDQCGEGDNCDITFLRESGRSCGGDGPCRLTSRRILDALRTLHAQPLACHHPCLASYLAKRR